MKNLVFLLTLGFAASALSASAMAAVSPQQAAELGHSLTEAGAIAAGNADGSIPRIAELTTFPSDFVAGSGVWADPYKAEKPLYRIDSKNLARYADKLSDGQRALLTRFPDYYYDVYPSHRTSVLPEAVRQASLRNATQCSTLNNGLTLSPLCRGGVPFPLPQTGAEVMWNQQMRYRQGATATEVNSSSTWIMDANGSPSLASEQSSLNESPYYQAATDRDAAMFWRGFSVTRSPARKAGEMTGLTDYLDPTSKPRLAWSYSPGQRRVRMAPEFNYDTPVASLGGIVLFDELFLFTGKMDRFDFKLIGRQEMFIPYNAYKLYFTSDPKGKLMEHHLNPAYERWELHRVWVVEATLKPGMRHVNAKRRYYFDEDNFGSGIEDSWDQGGNLFHVQFLNSVQLYDAKIPYNVTGTVYDLAKGMYALLNDVSKNGVKVLAQPLSNRDMNPEAIVARQSQR